MFIFKDRFDHFTRRQKMSKHLTILISVLVLTSILVFLIPNDVEGDSSPASQPVRFHMYGDSNNGNLSAEQPTSSDDEQADCPDEGSKRGQSSNVGTWRSEPFIGGASLSGNLAFQLWAKTTEGTVKDVTFSIQISVNGNQNTQTFQTNTNDTDTTPKRFDGNENYQANVGADDYLEIEITYSGNDEYWTDSGHTVILYGSTEHPSGFESLLNSVVIEFTQSNIVVNDANATEDKETIIATTTIRYALGMEDMVEFGFRATRIEYEGSLFDYNITEEADDHITVEWKWRYGDDHAPGGTYDINMTTEDRSGNKWWRTQSLRIVVQNRPRVDFVLDDPDHPAIINIIDPYTKKTGTIEVTLGCWGEAGLEGFTPLVVFEITDPLGETETIYRRPAIDSKSERIVSVPYYFNSTGEYTVDVEVNPRDKQSYEEANIEGTAEDNNVVTFTIDVVNKPKDNDEDKEWYEEIRDDIEDEPMYQMGLVAAIVVIVAVVILGVRRRRYYEEEEDYDEDEYVL